MKRPQPPGKPMRRPIYLVVDEVGGYYPDSIMPSLAAAREWRDRNVFSPNRDKIVKYIPAPRRAQPQTVHLNTRTLLYGTPEGTPPAPRRAQKRGRKS